MESLANAPAPSQQRLRAVIEIVNDDVTIFPIAQSDEQAQEIEAKLLAWGRRHVD
jgi:hypothetical protein